MSHRSHALGGWRVALRLARREAWRRKAQTTLMLVLVCLPVLAVAAAAVVWRTASVSGAEGVDRRMGASAALVSGSGTSEVVQAFDPDGTTSWVSEDEHVASAEEVRGVLGADRELVPLAREYLSYRTDRGVGDLLVTETDLANPLTEGLFRLDDGRYPSAADEVVVNPVAAGRGPGLGETLTVLRRTADGETRTDLHVVGIATSATTREEPVAAVLPGALGTPDDQPSWLVGGGPVSWDDVRALNAVGLLAASRQVLTDPPPDSALPPEVVTDEPVDETRLTALLLVATMVLLEVVLLAGPAFAVRARSQARTLALVAAAGGTPAQARRTVLASGVVVGLAAACSAPSSGSASGRCWCPWRSASRAPGSDRWRCPGRCWPWSPASALRQPSWRPSSLRSRPRARTWSPCWPVAAARGGPRVARRCSAWSWSGRPSPPVCWAPGRAAPPRRWWPRPRCSRSSG